MRVIFFLLSLVFAGQALAQDKPNMLIIWGDDIGFWNLSTNNMGMMGYDTPNIDRIAEEGAKFPDYYGQQSCTAGRSAFILGQSPIRTGLTKVGSPGADLGIRPEDVTLASLLKDEGYVTAQCEDNFKDNRALTSLRLYEFRSSIKSSISAVVGVNEVTKRYALGKDGHA